MKKLTKYLMGCALAVSALFAISSSANAVIITQDINFVGRSTPLATVTFEVPDYMLGGSGQVSVDLDSLRSISIIGWPFITPIDFEAIVNAADVFSGVEYIYIDGSDFFTRETWAYQFTVDRYFPSTNVVDIFNEDTGAIVAFGTGEDIYFGKATFVPEPSVLALFALGIAGLVLRRKVK